MRRVLQSLGLLLMLLGVAGPARAELKVVATLTDLGWLATQVGGERVEVSVLCPGYQDPHYLAAKPSLSRRLRKANLLLYNGLELEVGWLPLLIDAARNPGIRPGSRGELDCSQGVAELLQVPTGPVDRSQGDIHPLGNPHYLLDPRNGRDVGFLIAERLAELDPDGAQFYQDNAARLAATLDERAAAWQELAAPARGQVVMVYHQHWEAPLKIAGRVLDRRVIDSVWGFFAVYVATFVIFMLVLMANGLDQVTTFSAVATCMNNMGPGLGKVASNFRSVSDMAKWCLAFAMLLGRLEIFTLLVLLSPGFWRN